MNENTVMTQPSNEGLMTFAEFVKMKVPPSFLAIPELWNKYSGKLVRMINLDISSQLTPLSLENKKSGISETVDFNFHWKLIFSTPPLDEEIRLAMQDEHFYTMLRYYFLKQIAALMTKAGYRVDSLIIGGDVGLIQVNYFYEDIFNGLRDSL